MADRCYPLPGGGHVRASKPPTEEQLAAFEAVAEAARKMMADEWEAMTPEQRAEREARQARFRERQQRYCR